MKAETNTLSAHPDSGRQTTEYPAPDHVGDRVPQGTRRRYREILVQLVTITAGVLIDAPSLPPPSRPCCRTTGTIQPPLRSPPGEPTAVRSTSMPSILPAADRARWWRGSRGEWLVAAQLVLMALVFFGPRTVRALPAFSFPPASRPVGMVLMLAGGALLVWGIVRLGSRLTPLPYPKDGSTLVRTGPYAIVRHPMYCGGLGLAFGWALWVRGWLTLGYVCALFVLLDLKSRREERWLAEQFPAYPDYQRRVKRLIPFIF